MPGLNRKIAERGYKWGKIQDCLCLGRGLAMAHSFGWDLVTLEKPAMWFEDWAFVPCISQSGG